MWMKAPGFRTADMFVLAENRNFGEDSGLYTWDLKLDQDTSSVSGLRSSTHRSLVVSSDHFQTQNS